MSWIRGFTYRVLRRLRPTQRDHAFADEVEFHVSMEAQKYCAQGFSPTEARTMAEHHFGSVARLGDDLRDAHGDGFVAGLAADLRFALRAIRRSPGFTTVVALTFALGIGANSAVFTVVDSVVLRPLPFPQPEQLIHVVPVNPKEPGVTVMSYPDFRDYYIAKSIRSGAVFVSRNVTLAADADPVRLEAIAVSGQFFNVLGVRPALGRGIVNEDAYPGSPPVVVLSHALWTEQYGGDPTALGRRVRLNGRQYEIIGVMPEQFSFPERSRLWVPFKPTSYDLSENGRGNHDYTMIARLSPNTSVETATREFQLIAARLGREFPKTNADYSARAETLTDYIIGPVRTPLLLLLGAVTSILLIACANVANLLLARATGRQDEFAVRAALGAGSGRLTRLLLAEAFVLATIGGIVGLFVAWAGARALVATQPADIPRLGRFGVDGRLILYTSFVVVACTMLVAALPALRISRTSMYTLLRGGGRADGGRAQSRARRLLVVAETALAVMLLVGATLFLHSFVNLRRVDPGFRASSALTFGLTLPSASYDEARSRDFYPQLFSRIQAIPGIRAAGAVSMLPLGRSTMLLPFHVEGAAPSPDSLALISTVVATPGYFEAMGIEITRGRPFERKLPGAPQTVILSDAAVRQGLHDRPPLKSKIQLGWTFNGTTPIGGVVVGVARNVRATIFADARPTVYVEHAAAPLSTMNVVVRVDGTPEQYVAPIRAILRSMDPGLAMANVQTAEQLLARATSEPRFYTTLISTFAIIALALAILGLFGVVTYTVALRTREIGIRMALGANAVNVAGVVLLEGMKLAGFGVAIGILAALGLSRVVEGVLFNVNAAEPGAYVAAAVLLGLSAAVGALLPAIRAAQVDPSIALRAESA
jgi:putative ABC transport system permease protein